MHVTVIRMPEKYKKSVLDIIFKRIKKDDCVIFLFGAYATGENIRSSDIDIGVLSNYKIPARDFLEVEEELNNNVPTLRQIDFVDFSSVDEKVKREALKEIEIWHTGKNCRELLKNLKPARKN